MKSLQEIFDVVSTHLLTQKKQARQGVDDEGLGSGICQYRTSTGLKCAVGCLITDHQYTPVMERAGSLINFDSLNLDDLPEESNCSFTDRAAGAKAVLTALRDNNVDVNNHDIVALLTRLQAMHDNEEPRRWPARLSMLAVEFQLKYNHAEV